MIPRHLQGKNAVEIIDEQRIQFLRVPYNDADSRIKDRITQLEGLLLTAVKDALCNANETAIAHPGIGAEARAIEFLNLVLPYHDKEPTPPLQQASLPRFENPEWEVALAKWRARIGMACSCGDPLLSRLDCREHWQNGHFGKWEGG